MKRKLVAGVGILGSLLWASVANANPVTISIGYQEAGVNSGNITTEVNAGAVPAQTTPAGGYGTFTAVSTTGQYNTSYGAANPDVLGSTTLDLSTSSVGTINIYVTAQNITSPSGLINWISSFTENNLPTGWTVTESTYIDTADGVFTTNLSAPATTTQLGSASFPPVPVTQPVVQSALAGTGSSGAGYSVTELFSVTSTGAGTDLSTIDLKTTPPGGFSGAPGPAVGAGLPGLAVACFGLLAWRRSRRERA